MGDKVNFMKLTAPLDMPVIHKIKSFGMCLFLISGLQKIDYFMCYVPI